MPNSASSAGTRAARSALAVAVLLALPLAAAGGPALRATAIVGDAALTLQSGPARVLVQADTTSAIALSVSAVSWQVRAVSEVADVFDGPSPPLQDTLNYTHNEETLSPGASSAFQIASTREADATLLIQPLSADYRLAAASRGPFTVGPVEDTLLEASHYWKASIPPQPDYYEYRSDPALRVNLTRATTLALSGDLQLYVWGFTVLLSGDRPIEFETGYTNRPAPTGPVPLPDQVPLRREYYNYTVLTLHGAEVTLRTDAPARLFGDDFEAHALGPATLVGAQGSLPAVGGTYHLSGDATVDGGSFQWARRGDGAIGVRASHVDAAAGSVSFVPTPLPDRWWFPYAMGGGALGAVVAAALALPSVAGQGSPVAGAGGWRGVRARGYARWALAADASSRYGRAAFWMGLAARASPRDASFLVERGIFLRLAGKPLPALRAHREAHDLLRMLPDDSMAHNAYEAAKAAVAADLRVEALDWLRLAVEAEPALADEAQLEPEFAPLRDDPDYQSLTGPARLGGLLGA
jgi:hypothetical protein